MSFKSAIVMLVLLPALCSCFQWYPKYRYRLTVVVDTPEGVKQGSAIIEVETSLQTLPGPGIRQHAVGEAAVVDLGKRGLLFALPRGERYYDWAGQLYSTLTPLPPKGMVDVAAIANFRVKAAQEAKAPIVVPRRFNMRSHRSDISGYPLLVRFRDPADYRTLERVDPDDLAAAFGAGVKLDKVVVQITHDDPERRVIKYLPWLRDIKGPFNPNYTKVPQDGSFQNDLSSKNFDPEI